MVRNIDHQTILAFLKAKNIVVRMKSGKLLVSPKKKEMIDLEIAIHLVQLKRNFDYGTLLEEYVFNANETHFKFDKNDGKTLKMRGDADVKFSEVVSGADGMKMMFMLGGFPDAHFTTPMLIFQNDA